MPIYHPCNVAAIDSHLGLVRPHQRGVTRNAEPHRLVSLILPQSSQKKKKHPEFAYAHMHCQCYKTNQGITF